MPDLGIFSVPLFGLAALFVVSVVTGDDLAVSNVQVPATLQWSGFTSTVVTRMLTDELRDIDEAARAEDLGVAVESGYVDRSIHEVQDYYGVDTLMNGLQELMSTITYT